MAFIQTVQFSEESTEDIMMVSDSVGANAANWWTDIQLAQYMIGLIYIFGQEGGTLWTRSMTEAEIKQLPDPNVDFKKLSKTAALIKRFQDDVNLQGEATVYADGRIDRARGLVSSITGTHYTILIANYYFSDVIKNTQGAESALDWALNDADMPAMLKGQLQTRLEL